LGGQVFAFVDLVEQIARVKRPTQQLDLAPDHPALGEVDLRQEPLHASADIDRLHRVEVAVVLPVIADGGGGGPGDRDLRRRRRGRGVLLPATPGEDDGQEKRGEAGGAVERHGLTPKAGCESASRSAGQLEDTGPLAFTYRTMGEAYRSRLTVRRVSPVDYHVSGSPGQCSWAVHSPNT